MEEVILSNSWICIGSNVTSTLFDGIMEFPTSMRTSPTFSVTGELECI